MWPEIFLSRGGSLSPSSALSTSRGGSGPQRAARLPQPKLSEQGAWHGRAQAGAQGASQAVMRSVDLFSGPCEPLKGFDMDRTLCFAAGWRAVEGRQSGGRCWKLGRPQWAGGGENHGHFWRSHPGLLPVWARRRLWWPGLPQLGGGGAWRRRIWGPSGFVPGAEVLWEVGLPQG